MVVVEIVAVSRLCFLQAVPYTISLVECVHSTNNYYIETMVVVGLVVLFVPLEWKGKWNLSMLCSQNEINCANKDHQG